MRGGLFLFPLYVDPQDAAAADAREEVLHVAAQPAAGADSFNPQRLATLIRSSNGRLGSSETTEMDADALNSLPKWAQAVVQTGCFNAGAAQGAKSSPKNKLKRGLDEQDGHEFEPPRKRRSIASVGDVNDMSDESGELQDCLDELNAEPDLDVEMDDEEEIPTFSTQAEIAADTVEKYTELLERLLDVATQRQQSMSFEQDDLDVFSAEEVKMLLQSLKTMQKNDWIQKLRPELLISLMDVFDSQIRLGLAVDVLAAAAPNADGVKLQPLEIDDRLVMRLLSTLDVAICELIVMTTPQIDRRVLSEETIDNCFQLLHHVIRRLLLPCIDTTYVTTACAPSAKESNRRQSGGGKSSSSSRVNLRANKRIRKAVDNVSHVVCELMDRLATLVENVKLADRWIISLSSSMVELFALEHSSYATSLQQSALAILRGIFLQYKLHRKSLLADIIAVMVKLPTAKRTLRTVKLLSSTDTVQQISTLVVSMIQSCAPAGKFGAEVSTGPVQDSIEASSTPDTATEDQAPPRNDAVDNLLEEIRSSARSFVGMLVKECWKKVEERDNRVILDNFVEDLLVMFVRPEWVGAEYLLEVIVSSLASILHANVSADVKSPDAHQSLAALNLVGKICASIRRYQKKTRQSIMDNDSDAAAVIDDHISCLRESIAGKRKRSRGAKLGVATDVFHELALKHIIIMHLQRDNPSQSDSKKLLILKFISESEKHWRENESVYVEQETRLWESLWEVPKRGTNSTFKVAAPTSELALKASLHLAVKRQFCGLFDSLLAHVMVLLSKGMPSLRARVMKCLRGIVDVDPMLMAEPGVRSAVERCCSDEKPSVREAAVDLIGTYVLLQPVLFDEYFDVLAQRVRDKGIKVRKSVCKIFKIALTCMQTESRDSISEKELSRKSACMRCLVERIGDAAEDQGVKNFIIDTFQEVWFGADLSSFKLSNLSTEFGDGSTLPPGWTAAASEEKADGAVVSAANATFVSEDGTVACSVEEAWTSYRTPTVAPASVVKSNDSKLDNSSEVVSTIVDVIHGVPNLSWFAELLKRLLEERSSTRKTTARSTKSRSAEVAIAEDRSQTIIDRLVACLMDIQDGTLLKGVSIKDGHEQFVACMTALFAFCEAKPQLLVRHLETIRVYLKEEDVKVQSLSVSVINKILSVKRVSDIIARKLEQDLRALVLASPPSVVGPSVKCLSTLSTTRNKAPVLLLQLLERFSLVIRKHERNESLASLPEKEKYALLRALFAAGKIVGVTDIDTHEELAKDADLLYESYARYIRASGDEQCTVKAVQGLGFLFPIRPRLFLRAQQDGVLDFLLRSSPGKATLQCLISMKELLLYEEQRLENGLATKTLNQSRSKEEQVQGDQEADASLIGNVMQEQLGSTLLLALQKIPQIRMEAIACISALLIQGLVHPLQCIPTLVALETDRVSGVRDAAFSQLLALYERFRSQFHAPLIQGIQDSYSFQLRVYGNATALGIDQNKKEFCLFGRLYTSYLKPVKSHESLLLKALVNQFTDQGIILKPLKGKSAAANSRASTSDLKYLCYLAQILSALPYDVEDEPLYIIYSINRYVSLRLGPLLDDLKEVFAEAGLAPTEMEDDESDLSALDIDQYRPFRSLPGSKLSALQTNGRIAFALALMLRLKFALKRNFQLDNDKCATYKPSSNEVPVEAKQRSPKKLLLPSVDDLCQSDDPIELNWNLFMTAWTAGQKNQQQLDMDLEQAVKPKTPKTPAKRRRRSRRVAPQKAVKDSDDSDEYVEGFA